MVRLKQTHFLTDGKHNTYADGPPKINRGKQQGDFLHKVDTCELGVYRYPDDRRQHRTNDTDPCQNRPANPKYEKNESHRAHGRE